MSEATEIQVCMDIGSKVHRVAIGLSSGELLEEFDLEHTPKAIQEFFNRIEKHKKAQNLPVAVAMEGYNGHARPLDKYVLLRGYKLFNVNNNKLAQFKKVFPGPAKTDVIDTQKMFELFTLRKHLPLAKSVLQEVVKAPEANEKLKRLTRRRRLLVEEKTKILNRMQSDLQAICPGLLNITNSSDNIWFLSFLTSRADICQLKRMQFGSILKIRGIGKRYAPKIQEWQKTADFAPDASWVGDMIICDAKRILELQTDINSLEKHIEIISKESEIANRLKSIPGFGTVCAAELAGEIGNISRFTSESSLALYLGMATLTNQSGAYSGSKKTKHVNRRAKAALMTAIARHINLVAESKLYYDKKRLEGKKHNQAVRSLGRHMVRVIWSMIKHQRDYEKRNK